MSDQTAARPKVVTSLARAALETAHFRGYDVMEELLGEDHWSMVSLALGGRRLTPEECSLCELLGNVGGIGDPRIWPLKVTRLIGSYGRRYAAIAAAYAFLDEAPLGPNPVRDTAHFFYDAVRDCSSAEDDAAAIARAIDERIASGRPVPGFGVAGRGVDERNVALERKVRERAPSPGRFWRIYRAASDHALASHSLQSNFAATSACIGLDVGIEPDVMDMFVSIVVYWSFAANAIEAPRESPEILRRLPPEAVRWVGSPPRTSPRAEKASGR